MDKDHEQTAPRRLKSLHYAWVVAIIAFFTLLVGAGIRSTPGVLIVPLEQEFGWDRSTVSLALAINLILYGLFGPFAAALMDRYGMRRITIVALTMLAVGIGLSTWMDSPWQLNLFWGLVVGIGTGCIASVLGAMVANRWFVTHRGLVVGILTASGAAGQLVFLPLLAHLIVTDGWRTAAWTTSIAAYLMIPIVALFMRERPSDKNLPPYGGTSIVRENPSNSINPFLSAFNGLRMGLRSFDFWLLSGSFFICGLTTNGLIGTHFIPACMEHGISEVTAASMLALIGVFNMIGTTISGWLSDRWNNRWLLFWFYGLRGLSLLLLPSALNSSQISLGLFIIFYGLDWIATVPPTVRLTTDIFGKENAGILFGWIMAAHQLGAAAAAYGGGVLYTWLNSYFFTFLAAGFFSLIAAGMVMRIGKANTLKTSLSEGA